MLAYAGAALSLEDEEGKTPMMWALELKHQRIVDLLLLHRAVA